MKRSIKLTLLLLFFSTFTYAQIVVVAPIPPVVQNVIITKNTGVNGLVEIEFDVLNLPTHPTNPNPEFYYMDPDFVDIFLMFTSPSGKKYKVNAFYKEKYVFNPTFSITSQPGDCQYLFSVTGENDNGTSKVWGPYVAMGATAHEKTDRPGNTSLKNQMPLSKKWCIRFSPGEAGPWTAQPQMKLGTPAPSGGEVTFSTDYTSAEVNLIVGASLPKSHNYVTIDHSTNKLMIPRKGALKLVGENMVGDMEIDGTLYDAELKSSTSNKIGGICMYYEKLQELSNHQGNYFRWAFNGKPDNPDLVWPMQNYAIKDMNFSNNLRINQKNAFRCDMVLERAEDLEIFVKICLFECAMLTKGYYEDQAYNVFSAGPNPCEFFNPNSVMYKNFKNCARYIIARYGYSTNIVSWELIDESDVITDMIPVPDHDNGTNCYETAMYTPAYFQWFDDMSKFVKVQDNFNHLVSHGSWANGNVFSLPARGWQFTQLSNLPYIDFTENNQGSGGYGYDVSYDQITPPPAPLWQDINNICNPANFPAHVSFSTNLSHYNIQPSVAQSFTQKPHLMNSFWFGYNNSKVGAGSDFVVDEAVEPKGIAIHDITVSSVFSGAFMHGVPFFSERMHPGFARKINVWGTRNRKWNGLLHNFDQLRAVTNLIDFSQKYITRNTIQHYNIFGVNNGSFALGVDGEPNVPIRNANMYATSLTDEKTSIMYGWIKLNDAKIEAMENPALCADFFPVPGTDPYLKNFTAANTGHILYYYNYGNTSATSFEITWYKFTKDDLVPLPLPVQNNINISGASTQYIYFEVPPIDNIYGDLVFAIKRVTGYQGKCNTNDLIKTCDIDGDGKEEMVLNNRCNKNDGAFIYIDPSNGNIKHTIFHKFNKFDDWMDAGDLWFVADVDKSTPGKEHVLINKDYGSKGSIMVLNSANGDVLKTLPYDIGFTGFLDPQDKAFTGNVDADAADEIILINYDHMPGLFAVKVIDPFASTWTEYAIPCTALSSVFFGPNDRVFLADINGDLRKELVFINTDEANNAPAILALDLVSGNFIVNIDHGPTATKYLGWMDNCDRILCGNVMGDIKEEIIFLNTEYTLGQYAIRIEDILSNSIMNTIPNVGSFSDQFDVVDELFLADVDADGLKELISINKTYTPNTPGIRSISLQGGGATLTMFDNVPAASSLGYLDPTDIQLPVRNVDGLHPGRDYILLLNKPYQYPQFMFRTMDLLSAGPLYYSQPFGPIHEIYVDGGVIPRNCLNETQGGSGQNSHNLTAKSRNDDNDLAPLDVKKLEQQQSGKTNVGIQDFHELTIQPNPARDKITITSGTNITSIKILTSLGVVLEELNYHSNTAEINLSLYTAGVYYVEVITNNKLSRHKIIKL